MAHDADGAKFQALVTATAYVVYEMGADWSEMRRLDGRGFVADTTESTRSWMDRYIDPADQGIVRAAIAEAIRSKSLFDLEHRVRKLDGSLGWTLSRAIPMLDASGDVTGWFGAATDITAQKLAEERRAFLFALSERLRSLVDPNEAMAAASEALGRHLGVGRCGYGELSPDGAHARVEGDWTDGTVPSGIGTHRLAELGDALLEACRAGETVAIDDVREDPRTRDVPGAHAAIGGRRAMIVAPLVKDGRWLAALHVHEAQPRRWTVDDASLVRDVAERTWEAVGRARAEAASRAAEERYLGLFHAIDQGLCTIEVAFDADGKALDYRFLEVSPSFARQTGLADPVGRWMREIAPSHEQHWFDFYGNVSRTGRPARTQNRAAPLGRWWDVYAFPVSGGDRVAALLRDVTEQKRADESLREADRRKDGFLATLAHELRNPLAPLVNAVRLLRSEAAPASDAEVADVAAAADHARPSTVRLLDVADRQVRHLGRIVDDLLDVSRITQGAIELRREPLDLARVLQAAVDAVRPALDVHGQTLSVSSPDGEIPIDGDASRLAQVFTNLLGNAVKHSDEGSRIELEVERTDAEAVVRVRDHGIGIPHDQIGGVFALFAKVHRRDPRGEGGMGIGLSLADSLVRMHGGTVRAESAGRNAGSTFTVRLPLSSGSAPPAAADDGTQAAPLIGRRVLIVDDNRDAADTLAELLALDGAETKVVYGGESALAILKYWRPAWVVLDIGMPGLDGHAVARRIRDDAELANVGLIALTGWGQPDDLARTRASGFDHHLTKPVELSALLPLLAGKRRPGP